jgi:hypothetical protein
MKGKHLVIIGNNILRYKFEIRRNITIIKGNSATGKTTLVDMVREYYENGNQSGIELQCDKNCVVVEGRRWKLLLEDIHDSIVFIDEGNSFITTTEFSTAVKESDNYYVIVTRESLPNLPYSVEEIYGIKNSGKYGALQQVYQEFYRIYGNFTYPLQFTPDVIIVEDSNSGYEFFDNLDIGKNRETVSAEGKSNIYKVLKKYDNNKKVLVIADGAAFGSEIDRVMKTIDSTVEKVVYLPESFEWLILESGIIKDNEIKTILEEPSDFIESQEYISWERYFSALLIKKTKDTYLNYMKSKLNDAYKIDTNKNKILKVIPEYILLD